MNGSGSVLVFRLIHIVSGVFWVGGAIFIAMFLLPTLRSVGPAGGPVMSYLVQVRKLPLYMMGAAILTVLSGLGLYRRDSAGFVGTWVRSGTGLVFSLGALLGLGAVGLGMGVAARGAAPRPMRPQRCNACNLDSPQRPRGSPYCWCLQQRR
jgi:uncharacterized membrane protein